MIESILYLALAIAAFPAAMFAGAVIGTCIQKLLPSKSDTPVAVCAILALVVTCVFVFGGSSSPGEAEQWFRR
jgi:hypothetical protein